MSVPTAIVRLSAVAGLLYSSSIAAQTAPSNPPITSVLMHRSACYGPCPVYTVEVLPSGEVRYDGQDHVKVKGHRTSHISPSDFLFLFASIMRVRFFGLQDQYRSEQDGCPSVMTDNPTVDIVVTHGGQKKHVSYYYGCKGLEVFHQIIWLSDTIDDVANSVQWVGPDVD